MKNLLLTCAMVIALSLAYSQPPAVGYQTLIGSPAQYLGHEVIMSPFDSLRHELKSSRPIVVDHSFRMPPIGDQGHQGSCTAWALTGALGFYKQKTFSPAFIYNLVHHHGARPGITFPDALNFVIQNGGALMSEFPYDQDDDSTRPSPELRIKSLYYQVATWRYTRNAEIVKDSLAAGHVVLTALTYHNGSGHAICLVGYNDTINLGGGDIGGFKYWTSVGTAYGENGYGWIPYNAYEITTNPYFYFLVDGLDLIPEIIFPMDFNLATKAYYWSERPENQVANFYFLSGRDTLRKVTLVPSQDKFYLRVNHLADIQGATSLVVESSVRCWTNHIPYMSLEFYDASYLDDRGQNLALEFVSELKTAIFDSLITAWDSNYDARTTLTVRIDLPQSGSLEEKEGSGGLQVCPNPCREQANLRFNLPVASQLDFSLYDALGRVILTWSKTCPAGDNLINFSVANLPVGFYTVRTLNQGKMMVKKILVNH